MKLDHNEYYRCKQYVINLETNSINPGHKWEEGFKPE